METWTQDRLKHLIRTIPDYPIPGIRFRDITPLLSNGPAFHFAVEQMAALVRDLPYTKILGIESRGFIFAAALAYHERKGLTLVRKEGKLPAATWKAAYSLEYGKATLEMHQDGVSSDDRVLIVDDLLATGGTARASLDLVRRAGGKLAGYLFLIELVDLPGRRKLEEFPVRTIMTFTESE